MIHCSSEIIFAMSVTDGMQDISTVELQWLEHLCSRQG